MTSDPVPDAMRASRLARELVNDPKLLDAIIDVSGLLVVALDDQGRIVLFNRACEELTGYREEDVRGLVVWEFLTLPDETSGVRTVHANLAAGRGGSRHENYWVTRGGERRFISWNNTPLRRDDGEPPLILGTGIDITERVDVGSALRETAARLRAILETALLGIVTIDDLGVIESFNPAAERLFGFSSAEVVGRNVSVLMPEPDRSAHDGYIARYRETGEPRIIGIGREVRGLRKDGTTFPFQLSVSEVRVPGKRLFTGFIHDITDRREAETMARRRLDELAHASRLSVMGELSSGIAHEINQPLTAVVTFADACLRMLRAGRLDKSMLEDAVSQMAEQGERASEIIRRFRSFVRKDASQRDAIDLNGAVMDVVALMEHDLAMHGLSLSLDVQAGLPPVMGDKVQLEQVVLNLIRNAMESTSHQSTAPKISVTTRRVAEGIELLVDDNGPGVSEKDRERVFDAFFTTKATGMGMGLSVSRSIVVSNGGTMWCEPGPLGGARFVCRFPISEEASIGG